MFTSGSPNAGQLQIGIALVLQDRFSNQAREASSQIRRLHQEAKNVTNANLNAVQSLSGMGAAAGGAALYGLSSVIQQGAKFIDTMTFVDAIATKGAVSMDSLKAKAQSLGRETMFGSQDIASAMQYFAMSGMNTEQIFNSISAAANLAGGTMSELGGKGGAADILTNIMKMFRIEFSEANTSRITDILVKGVTSANTNLYDLAEAIKYAGTTVTNLGGSVEQTAAFIGVLGNAGIQGSMAGTAMANTYRYLTKSIEDTRFKGNKALASLGLNKSDFIDANGRLIDMGLAMQKIAIATRGMSDTKRFNTLVSILGVRGERGGSTMVKAFEDYRDLLDKVQNQSQGTAATVMEKRMESIAGGIDKMVSSLENVKTTFTEAIAPVLTPIFNGIAVAFDLIQKVFSTKYIGPAVASLITFGTLLVTIKLAILAMKSSWRLMFNDSTVSFANMVAVMKQGWSSASISAAQYKAIEAGIIAQRKAGIVSNSVGAGVVAATSGLSYIQQNPGQRAGGIFYKNGRYYQETGRGATGVTRITAATATQKLATKSPTQLGLISATAPAAGAIGSGLLRGGLFRGLGLGLRGIVGMLGGPVTIGLTALTFFLPQIVEALFGSSDSQDNNTKAIQDNTEEQRKRSLEALKPLSDEEQRIMIANALNNLSNTLMNKPVANLIVNVDGKETIQQLIDSNQNNQVVDVGSK